MRSLKVQTFQGFPGEGDSRPERTRGRFPCRRAVENSGDGGTVAKMRKRERRSEPESVLFLSSLAIASSHFPLWLTADWLKRFLLDLSGISSCLGEGAGSIWSR